MSDSTADSRSSNPPTATPAPAPTKVVRTKSLESHAGNTKAVNQSHGPNLSTTAPLSGRPSSGPRSFGKGAGMSPTTRGAPAHQVSPPFISRTTRARGSSTAGVPTSPSMGGGLSVPVSPTTALGGMRRAPRGSLEFVKRRHRRTMSDTPTSPFWSPSFEFMHSEDPEVVLEDEKYLSHVKVDEVAPPSEEDKKKQLMRSISFPASLKKDHHRTTSMSSSLVSPLQRKDAAAPEAPKSPSMSVRGLPPRRRTLGALSCTPEGRPMIAGSPRTQALNTSRSPVAASSTKLKQQRGAPGLPRQGSVGATSPPMPASSGVREPISGTAGYTPVSTQRAERARRSLPRRATTDLTANRPSAR